MTHWVHAPLDTGGGLHAPLLLTAKESQIEPARLCVFVWGEIRRPPQAAAAMNMKGKYDHIFTISGNRNEIMSEFRFRRMKCTAVPPARDCTLYFTRLVIRRRATIFLLGP